MADLMVLIREGVTPRTLAEHFCKGNEGTVGKVVYNFNVNGANYTGIASAVAFAAALVFQSLLLLGVAAVLRQVYHSFKKAVFSLGSVGPATLEEKIRNMRLGLDQKETWTPIKWQFFNILTLFNTIPVAANNDQAPMDYISSQPMDVDNGFADSPYVDYSRP